MISAMSGKTAITHHFPHLSESQWDQLNGYADLLKRYNQSINLISRKNESRIWEEHILHSLGIAKIVTFKAGDKVLDFGTGGGLPGIPLAICFPSTSFLLVDSIGKKVRVVQEIVDALGLSNVRTRHTRVEDVQERFHFAVSRAVTALPRITEWLEGKVLKGNAHEVPNGLLYLKGGDFEDELDEIDRPYQVWNMADWFKDPFFETKKVLWLDLAH